MNPRTLPAALAAFLSLLGATNAARKYDDARLLGEIVDPSRTVAPKNALHSVELADATIRVGHVAANDERAIRIRDAAGEDHVVAKSDIRTDERQGLSAMPQGLLSNLTAQEAADLLAALRGKAASRPKGTTIPAMHP